MMNFKRVVCFLSIFLVICLLVSCGKNQQSKKFSNRYFSFNYPKDWTLSSSENNVTVTGPIEDAYFVNVKFDFNPEIDIPVDEFKKTVEKQNRLELMPGFVNGEEKEIKVSNLDAIKHSLKTVVKPTENAPNITLFVNLIYVVSEDRKVGVVITTEVPERFSLKYEKIFNEIIDSFKLNR
jgi:hypothetical protein